MARSTNPAPLLRVLAAVARGALGSDYDPDVPARMLSIVGRLASSSERARLSGVLRALDTRPGALALTGRAVPVSWLTPAQAEGLLQRWSAARLPLQNQLGRALTSLAVQSLYGYPGPHWQRIGYPGPLTEAPEEPRRLEPITITSDEEMVCDAVVVGSGAGGGCTAARLAEAGLNVVVLEKGGYFAERDFHHGEGQATAEMYLYGGTLTTADQGVQILAGSVLGGGTLVNYTTSFRTPEHVLRGWAEVSGIDAFVSGEFEAALDEVSTRLGVNTDSSAAGRRDELMEEGLKKLGWHVDMMPRAVRGCSQDEACGYCGFGCRLGAKQSTMRTFLHDAAERGTRLVVGVNVTKVVVEDGRAVGVEATSGPNRLRVKARAVVAAAGAVETPALLLRSRLGGRVGHNIRLHPGSAVWGTFDDDVKMWEGTLQARYSNEFRDWDGGWGPIFETVPVHPGGWATIIPWQSAAQHRSLMDTYRNTSFCAVLPRDASGGRVRIGRDGSPRIDYKLTIDDQRRIAEGIQAAAQVMEAAGAREVRSPDFLLSYQPGTEGARERWAEEVARAGYGTKNARYFSYHQMGSCRMGLDPASSAIDDSNESHEVKNLFVVDGSAFPLASGVNPMLSIYGIANRAGKLIAKRLS